MSEEEEGPKGKKGDYAVGYGKPPLHTRFPHQARSSSTRKRKEKTLQEYLRKELQGFLTVRDPATGQIKKVLAAQQIARNVRNKAAQNDPKAVSIFLSLDGPGALTRVAAEVPVLESVSKDEKAIMARFARKFLAAEQTQSEARTFDHEKSDAAEESVDE